jgi:hypothetical protein
MVSLASAYSIPMALYHTLQTVSVAAIASIFVSMGISAHVGKVVSHVNI